MIEDFEKELAVWHKETWMLSLVNRKRKNQHYINIVSMGIPAVPLILQSIRKEPNWIVMALYDITGENPVQSTSIGKIGQICADWIIWGMDNKYL